MELRDATRKLMAETEQATGCQVVVTEDRTLTMMSGVVMAAANHPAHLIRLHPKAVALVDYYVAYYCGMIQRFFENPPDSRVTGRRSRRLRRTRPATPSGSPNRFT